MNLAGKTLLMMAGGTGGHVYPALAVAQAAREAGASVHWLGNAQGFEGRKVPAYGFAFHDIAVRGLRGNGLIGWLQAPIMLTRAIRAARRVIKDIRPDAVIGMGGFAAGPGGVAAKMAGVPLIIHEQNAVAGLTNRLLARVADVVLLGDARASARLRGRGEAVGNPVRAAFADVPAPAVRYAARAGKIRLLVLGGSQGAKALNTLLPQALALLPEAARPEVLHQAGERGLPEAQSAYVASGVEAQVVPFMEDMASAYADADWVIARSGALTVAEIATVGLPALFVPFPHAVDDHQTANAQTLVDAGAAQVVQQADLTADILAGQIAAHADRTALRKKAEAARAVSHGEALERIMDAVYNVIAKNSEK
ncbi:MAG: undecaprenyldiphospho-muramoylpentapeptide beta-N-acetylglucosaminyltransferase [Cardiobacteriaceae bacterium]|nr:undecaprenyldiphospho-muramoylpentapeptide beta-N-acetylglucosaminyltransferase [Cardiobacteriaceae bacterium]